MPPRVPADWEPQQAVWIAWPHNRETWPGRFELIPAVFRQLVRAISETLPVHVIGSDAFESGANLAFPNVTWFDIETNDCWIRDYGPLFVLGDQPYCVDWTSMPGVESIRHGISTTRRDEQSRMRLAGQRSAVASVSKEVPWSGTEQADY